MASGTPSAPELAQSLLQSGSAVEAKDVAKKEASAVKSWILEGPLALKVLCFLACAAGCTVSVLSGLASLLNPTSLLISVYAAVLTLLGALLEVKPLVCTRRCKARVEFWAKLLGRVWGRGLFYVLCGALLLSLHGVLTFICGLALIGVGALSIIVSRAASWKLSALHAHLVARYGTKDENTVRAAFQEFDRDGSGALEPDELAQVAASLGAPLSKDEMRAVFDVLDQDASGRVDFEEFRSWWNGDKKVDYSAV